MNLKTSIIAIVAPIIMNAQQVMTPEIMWSLKRLGVQTVSPDQSQIIFGLSKTDLKTEKSSSERFILPSVGVNYTKVDYGKKSILQWDKNGLYALEGDTIFVSKDQGKTWSFFYKIGEVDHIKIAPDGKSIAFSKEVLIEKNLAKDKYQDTPNSTAHIYSDLNHRHWDYFNQGKYNHIFVVKVNQDVSEAKDLLEGKMWDSPQRPFGGGEDFTWSPDSTQLLFVTKPKSGIDYAKSTNTDIFAYDIATSQVTNLTESNKGYDNNPQFSPDGKYLMYTSMARDGYEADKNDIKVLDWKTKRVRNLTQNWDETLTGYTFWAKDSKIIYFTSAIRGTHQLFALNVGTAKVQQITKGDFDVNGIYAENKGNLVVSRNDINHNADLYSVEI